MAFREYSFEKLIAWKEAKELCKIVYKLTVSYPIEEKYGLTSQMRRSAISVASNLAEGSARKTNKDKAHFSTQAYSSLMELLNQLILSVELDFMEMDDYLPLRNHVDRVAILISKLRQSQERQA